MEQSSLLLLQSSLSSLFLWERGMSVSKYVCKSYEIIAQAHFPFTPYLR